MYQLQRGVHLLMNICEKICLSVLSYEDLYVIILDSLMDSLPDLLHQCDYICNVLPSTEATRNLLSGDTLKNCKAKVHIGLTYINLKLKCYDYLLMHQFLEGAVH
jgi:hypothetical protein